MTMNPGDITWAMISTGLEYAFICSPCDESYYWMIVYDHHSGESLETSMHKLYKNEILYTDIFT